MLVARRQEKHSNSRMMMAHKSQRDEERKTTP